MWVDWFNHRRLLEPIGYVPPARATMSRPPAPDSHNSLSRDPGTLHLIVGHLLPATGTPFPRTIARHVELQSTQISGAARLQAGMLPGACDDRVLHAQLGAGRSRGPVRGAVRRRATRPRHDARLQGGGQDGRLRAAVT